jgi:hypothetical protein
VVVLRHGAVLPIGGPADGAINLLMAKTPAEVLNLLAYAWAGVGATFGPVLLLSCTGPG